MKSPAHATFKGDAICGALLTGKSPEGRPFCDACLGIMFDWLAAFAEEVLSIQHLSDDHEWSNPWNALMETIESRAKAHGIAVTK